jgi:hypothetical protein
MVTETGTASSTRRNKVARTLPKGHGTLAMIHLCVRKSGLSIRATPRLREEAVLLEKALSDLEAELAEIDRDAAVLRKAVNTARKAAQQGSLGEIGRAIEQGQARAIAVGERLAQAAGHIAFDHVDYLASEAYLDELKEAAKAAGLALIDRDGRLSAFPLLLKIDSKALAVRLNRKADRRVRPSFLVAQLKLAQDRASGFKLTDFLKALFGAYQRLSREFGPGYGPSSRGLGPVVPLLDVYETLTLMPGAARDYPIEEFGRDLLLLDRAPDLLTASGHGFRLPASTGSKSNKRITVYDEHGAEHVYVGLQFKEG